MTLDFGAVAGALHAAGPALRRSAEIRRDRVTAAAEALRLLHAEPQRTDPQRMERRSRQLQFLPGIVDTPLDMRLPAPPIPGRYSVVATDGSQIAPDAHGALLYYVINVGRVAIHYGDPGAQLDSQTAFTCREDDLFVEVRGRRELIDEAVLSTKRKLEELRALRDLAREQRREAPLLALQDGSLILTEHESVARAGAVVVGIGETDGTGEQRRPRLLEDYVAALNALVAEKTVVAGYISRPRSDIVATLLRALVCDHDDASWRVACAAHAGALCARLAGATDRDVIEAINLRPGERSVRFRSRWQEARHLEPGMEIDFFFLRTDDEVARVQLPAKLAEDAALLDFCHAALADQCRRGGGYPPALAEAHEQAVIPGHDRHAVAALVERELARLGVPAQPSAKQRAKDRRAV